MSNSQTIWNLISMTFKYFSIFCPKVDYRKIPNKIPKIKLSNILWIVVVLKIWSKIKSNPLKRKYFCVNIQFYFGNNSYTSNKKQQWVIFPKNYSCFQHKIIHFFHFFFIFGLRFKEIFNFPTWRHCHHHEYISHNEKNTTYMLQIQM